MKEASNEIHTVSEDEIDLLEIVRNLWRNRKPIISITAVFMVIGVVYALIATPFFTSTLTMYPVAGGKKASGLMSMAASFGVNVGGGNTESYDIEDVIKSKKVAKEIILKKWNIPGEGEKNLIEYWGIGEDDEEMNDVLKLYEANKRFVKTLAVSKAKESGLISVSVTTTNPHLSAQVANYIGEAVTEYVHEYQSEVNEKDIRHIDIRLRDVEIELKNAEQRLKDYQEKNKNINSPQVQLEMARLSRELEIKQGVYLTLSQQKELVLIDKVKKEPVVNILDKAEVPMVKSKPKGSLICIGFTFLGGMLGIGLVLLLLYIKNNFGEYKLTKLVK